MIKRLSRRSVASVIGNKQQPSALVTIQEDEKTQASGIMCQLLFRAIASNVIVIT